MFFLLTCRTMPTWLPSDYRPAPTAVMACTSDASTVPDGFDYDLFIAATVSLKWSEGVNYTIKCMEKKQVLDALLAGDAATCYMAIGGIQVDADLIENGLEYTWSYYQGGLRILTTASTSTGGMWAFLDTFTWQLWVLLAGTAAAVPLIGWIAEGIVWGKERHDSLDAPTYRGFKGLGSMVWHFSTFFVSFEPLDFRTWANRLLAIAYGFLLVVVIALYTANTAAQVALTTVNYKVNSLADLKGQAVGTTAELAPTVRGLGLAPSVFPWGTGADEVAVKDDLLMGAYTAVILDNAWVDYAATNDTACQLKAVGPLFNMTNYAFAFPKGTPASTLTEWDLLLTDLQGRLFIIDKLVSYHLQKFVTLAFSFLSRGRLMRVGYTKIKPTMTYSAYIKVWSEGPSYVKLALIFSHSLFACRFNVGWTCQALAKRRAKSTIPTYK